MRSTPSPAVVGDAEASWAARPVDLRALDASRERDPDWYLSNRMLGGVCYVDRYAGDLDGVRARIPYFEELGLTYLHLMPLFEVPGGQLRRRLRRVELPARSTPHSARWTTCARSPPSCARTASRSCVDFIFNHTANEHEWARKAVAGDPQLSRTST